MADLKRVYRCPECDVIILKKLYFNSIHNCSCGTNTHIKNLRLEFEERVRDATRKVEAN